MVDIDTASALPALTADQRRSEAAGRLTREAVDVLVVGGGITGAGIARDAALRGLRVAIIDKSDWGSGTSSRSSKLVHGGLRYLENLQFGLVMESTRERYRQRRLNPHLVWPIPFLMPVYADSRHGIFKLSLGLWLYDLLALFRSYRLHRRLDPQAARGVAPGLRSEGLRGALHYYDCRTDDARLTLANVLDAERHGATALNYTRFEGPRFDDAGRVVGAAIRDEFSGVVLEVPCRHIVFATGHWSDQTPAAAGGGHLIRPTKGVHVVVARERLPIDAAVTLTAVRDGRVMFAIPFENTTYVGTTDTDYDGDLDDVRATSEDIAYLLETANYYFPDADLKPSDVRSTWAGLRPLIRSDAESAYKTSREHEIYPDPRGITTIAGGKLTTYRAMAAELMRHVVRDLARHHGVRAARCRTHKVPLDPALPFVANVEHGPEDPLDRALWRAYGSDAGAILATLRASSEAAARLVAELPFVFAQVSWAVRHEHAVRLADVLVRRLPIFYRAADQGLGCAPAVAAHMAAILGFDARWVDDEVRDYVALVHASREWQEPVPAPLAETG